jgi:hypothetical protein
MKPNLKIRCEVCGEPMIVCGGCGFVRNAGENRRTNMDIKWGFPPEKFEEDSDLYNQLSFQRKYWREKQRRSRGHDEVDDLFEDAATVHVQCPYPTCETWFPAPSELVNKRSKNYTGKITCPCCHTTSKVGRAGELEKM